MATAFNIDDLLFNKSRCVCDKYASKKCSRCKVQRYCSKECQLSDWNEHKNICSPDLRLNDEDMGYYLKKGLKNPNISEKSDIKTEADRQKQVALNISKYVNKEWIENLISYRIHNDIEERKERIDAHVRENWVSLIDTLFSSTIYFNNSSKNLGSLLYIKSKALFGSKSVYYYFIFHIINKNLDILYMRYAIQKPVEYYAINSIKQYILTSFDVLIGKDLIIDEKKAITTVPYQENPNYREVNWLNGEFIE